MREFYCAGMAGGCVMFANPPIALDHRLDCDHAQHRARFLVGGTYWLCSRVSRRGPTVRQRNLPG
jgi:hypothetical protein